MYSHFPGNVSYGLPVPYQTTISPPLSHGSQIHISGTPTGGRFEVNLKNQQNIILHFNPRVNERTLVLNSSQGGTWGSEERHGLQLQAGAPFTLVIMVTHHGFSISVNNAHLCDFHQRMPMSQAQSLEIKGDVTLTSAQVYPGGMGGSMGFPQIGMVVPNVQPIQPAFGGNVSFGYPSAPPSISIPSYPMGGSAVPSIQSCRIHPGSRIYVRGFIPPGAHRFELNLLQGFSDSDDIAFHFNPRFDARQIVKNHRRGGQWGHEENQPFPAHMPLMPGTQIDLQIACLPDRYTVFMNNHLIAEYHHKITPGSVMALQYKGDITVTSVGQL